MTTEKRTHERDPRTGRFVHNWLVIGAPTEEHKHVETHECDGCGKVRAFGPKRGNGKIYKNKEAARAAGEMFDEGY
jgi:hypothetical protein